MPPVDVSSTDLTLSDSAHWTSVEIQGRLEEFTPNYTQWIVRMARQFVGRRLLDVGCSTGNVTRHFLDCELLAGVDPNPYALEKARLGWGAHPQVQLHQMTVPSREFLTLADLRFDSVTCLNVIEHVKDDREALRQIREVLQPAGRLILIVPANPWLYGSMDAADHHYRRYTRKTLVESVEGARLQVLSVRAMNAPGVVGWFLNGRVLRRRLIPSKQADLYDRFIPLIERLERFVPPPLGQSLVLVAQR